MQELPEDRVLNDLWLHCDSHQEELFAQDHCRCEMGCDLGFADIGHRMEHYSKAKCFHGELSSAQCPEPGCVFVLPPDNKSEDHRKGEVLNHYTTTHASSGSHKDGYFKDDVC